MTEVISGSLCVNEKDGMYGDSLDQIIFISLTFFNKKSFIFTVLE